MWLAGEFIQVIHVDRAFRNGNINGYAGCSYRKNSNRKMNIRVVLSINTATASHNMSTLE